MKTKSILAAISTALVLLLFQGCAPRPNASRTVVGIDVGHGSVWPGLVETLAANGYTSIALDRPMDSASLEKIGILLIAAPGSTYAPAEVNAIRRFVKSGGGLVCAGQAWSWTYKEYGNKPIDTYPLNVVGRRLKFWVAENSVGAPVELGTAIMADIDGVERSDWWPSEVRVDDKSGKPILKDENHKTIGALQSHGRGKIVAYGHEGILKDNPRILVNSVNYVAGFP